MLLKLWYLMILTYSYILWFIFYSDISWFLHKHGQICHSNCVAPWQRKKCSYSERWQLLLLTRRTWTLAKVKIFCICCMFAGTNTRFLCDVKLLVYVCNIELLTPAVPQSRLLLFRKTSQWSKVLKSSWITLNWTSITLWRAQNTVAFKIRNGLITVRLYEKFWHAMSCWLYTSSLFSTAFFVRYFLQAADTVY